MTRLHTLAIALFLGCGTTYGSGSDEFGGSTGDDEFRCGPTFCAIGDLCAFQNGTPCGEPEAYVCEPDDCNSCDCVVLGDGDLCSVLDGHVHLVRAC